MHIRKINKPIFDFSPEHPARQFLEAFVDCRKSCVGRELEGVDQEWFSAADMRKHRFSSFVYEWLSFDVELDGWLHGTAGMTASERRALETISLMKRLAIECKTAAMAEKNLPVVKMCDQLLHTLQLWAHCIDYRLQGHE